MATSDKTPPLVWSPIARALTVAGALAAGILLGRPGPYRELGYVLEYGAYVAVSILSEQRNTLLVISASLGLVWLLLVIVPTLFKLDQTTWVRAPRLAVGVLNLHLSFFEALLFAVVALAAVAWPLWIRLPLVAVALLFGPSLLELRWPWRPPLVETDEWSWKVRWGVIAPAVSLALVGWLAYLTPGQPGARRFFLVIVIGAGLRLAALVLRVRLIPPAKPEGHRALMIASRGAVWFANLVALGAVVAWLASSLAPAIGATGVDHWQRAGRLYAAPTSGDPTKLVSLFLVSDSQFHEVRGRRNGGQASLIEDLVSVAVRPVELDLLSGAPLAYFAQVYRALATGPREKMKWAHLGDFGDLGCLSELERVKAYVERFSRPGENHLAALVPGNHDSTFFGNFSWHPAWSEACGDGRARVTKKQSDQKIYDAEKDFAAGAQPPVEVRDERTYLARVTPLGEASGVAVLGAFLDTSDYAAHPLGIAGAQGSISDEQRDAVMAALPPSPASPVVLLMHHPFVELSPRGRENVRLIAAHLGPRLLAVVSSHTHLAACRADALGGRWVPELIVGSTIDPPQEAALLEIDPLAKTVFLRTIPSVARAGQSSSLRLPEGVAITDRDCGDRRDALKKREGCRELLADPDEPRRLARDLAPEVLRQRQETRARQLIACIDDAKQLDAIAGAPFERDDLYSQLSAFVFARLDGPRDKSHVDGVALVCMAWAGAILQGRKAEDWTYAKAIDHAFEGGATFQAEELAVTARDEPSRETCDPCQHLYVGEPPGLHRCEQPPPASR